MPFEYKIVGTSHVAKESKKKIKQAIEDFQPDIICVELDKNRLFALLEKKKSKMPLSLMFKIGFWGYVFSLVGKTIQQKLGEKLNIVAGQDMLTAVILAGERKIPLSLIDQNIQITMSRLSKNFKWKDKWNLIKDSFRGIFAKKKILKEYGLEKLDLNKVPSEELVEKMVGSMKHKFPGLYKVLVHERNVVMSNNIVNLLKKEPQKRVLAVVGAGHKQGMEKIINQKLLKLEYLGK